MPDQDWRLVVDVGGTNVRFARAVRNRAGAGEGRVVLSDATTGPHGAFTSFGECLAAYLATLPPECGRPASVAIGAAGLVRAEGVQLTNAKWFIGRKEVGEVAGTRRVAIVNDLQAVARVIPELKWCDVETLRFRGRSPISPADRGARVLGPGAMAALGVNVGTGFGCSAVHRVSLAAVVPAPRTAGPEDVSSDAWLSFASEAGHMTSGLLGFGEQVSDPGRSLVAQGVRSVEGLLSGEGVAKWASAIAKRSDVNAQGFNSAQEAFENVEASAACRQTVLDISQALGASCRNLLLAHGTWDGVFLVGSVVRGWYEANVAGKRAAFEAGFLTQGKMSNAVAATPVHVITLAQPELLGLAHLDIG